MVDFPLYASFAVLSASTSDELTTADELSTARRRLSLVLRARRDVAIVLSSGEPLSSVDTHLTLVAGLSKPRELATELKSDESGFLIHSVAENEPPFVHGTVVWAPGPLPYHLLNQGLRANILLAITSLRQLLDYEGSHVWQPGRDAMLRISSYTINCTNSQDN